MGVHFKPFPLDVRKFTKTKTLVLLNEFKDDINSNLPTEININKTFLLSEKLLENEQGKLIRFYYTNEPYLDK